MITPHKQPTPQRFATLCAALLATGLMAACSSSDDPIVTDNDIIANEEQPFDPSIDGPSSPAEGGSMPSSTIDLVPQQSASESVGIIYVDENGNSLYTRYTDQPDLITCAIGCAQQWPPLTTIVTTPGISGNFDPIAREDGTSQWALLGYPLHLYAGDANAGDVNGNGVDNQWALARPVPTTSADVDGDEALVALGTTRADGVSDTRNSKDGYTLYFFDNDTDGVSTCTDGCSTSWPPLFADTGAVADSDRYTLITRENGAEQWAYDGRALHFWQGDNAAGEFSGAEVEGWSIARP